MTVICPACGSENHDGAAECVVCLHDMSRTRQPSGSEYDEEHSREQEGYSYQSYNEGSYSSGYRPAYPAYPQPQYVQPQPYYPQPAYPMPYPMPVYMPKSEAEKHHESGMICGVLGFVLILVMACFAIVPGIFAIYYGKKARDLDPTKGTGPIILGVISVAINIIILVFILMMLTMSSVD